MWDYYEQPTAAELAEHLRTAIEWANAHPTLVPSRTLLIYAWNENDEGGWLVPTQQEGTARLDALREVLVQPMNVPVH